MKVFINNIISIILTTLIYLLGGFDIALLSFLIMMTLDYLTGVLSALYNKELSSKIGFRGIIKKFATIIVVAMAVVIDRLLGETNLIRTFVLYYFVANDGLSIIENMAEMNIKLPNVLIEALEQLKERNDNK